MDEIKITLPEKEIPTHWYNIQADMPNIPKPPLNPATGQPVTPDDLKPIFPMGLITQEASRERWIEIPDEVREIYRLWRPSPLFRARRLEKALDTPARIFYKYEGVSPAGSHKLNTAVAQAYYNKVAGIKRLTTETGAGQWGTALSQACNFFGLECVVYMVRVSFRQKPYRRSIMEIFGAKVYASPSENTAAGRQIRAEMPDTPGSLGIAISEAIEEAAGREDTNYSLGSVLNHVCLHQTVVGLETKEQMAIAGYYPDVVIGCVGGGSNFSGFAFPFAYDKLTKGAPVRLVAVEPTACPTLTRGLHTYDFGDVAGFTPLLYMHTLGSRFIPPGIHAGGLRYHGDAPLLCQLVADGVVEAQALNQTEVFQGAITFARSEGIVPAPESAHAIAWAIREALQAKEAGETRTIAFNLSGHGLLDLAAYDNYLSGQLEDYPLPESELQKAMAALPKI